MKQYLIRSLVIVSIVLGLNSAGSAQEKVSQGSLDVSITQPNTQELKLVVKVSNPERKKVNVTLLQKNAGILYSKSFTGESYGEKYNMDALEDGEYSIEVEAGTEKIVKEITVNTVVAVNRVANVIVKRGF